LIKKEKHVLFVSKYLKSIDIRRIFEDLLIFTSEK